MKLNIAAVLEEAQAADDAGFTAGAQKLREKAELARKLAIAYEHYKIVPEEKVQAFQAKLKATTERPMTSVDARKLRNPQAYYNAMVIADQLVFCSMESYAGVPPKDVLNKVKEAKAHAVFDGFEVAEVQPVATEIKLPDPIVFGRINGCTDRFFVAEWGQDVSITDLIGKHDG